MKPPEMVRLAREKAERLGDKAWHDGGGASRVFCAVCGDGEPERYVSVDTGKRLPSRHPSRTIREIRMRVCESCVGEGAPPC